MLRCGWLWQMRWNEWIVWSLDHRGCTTLIIADGARCYNPLAKKNKLFVRQWNHRRGQFSIWRWFRNRGKVRIHTSGIDPFWTILKSGIPPSLRSNVNGRANPTLWLYARSTHWRWENDTANLMHKTGQTLRQLWSRKRENESASFLTTKCCKGCSETLTQALFLRVNLWWKYQNYHSGKQFFCKTPDNNQRPGFMPRTCQINDKIVLFVSYVCPLCVSFPTCKTQCRLL